MSASVLPGHVSGETGAALGGARVILIHGTRQTGKTTLARQVCDPFGRAPSPRSTIRHWISLGDRLTLLCYYLDLAGS